MKKRGFEPLFTTTSLNRWRFLLCCGVKAISRQLQPYLPPNASPNSSCHNFTKSNTVYSVAYQPYRYGPNSHSRRQHVIQHVRHKGFIPSLPKRSFPFATHMVFGSFFQDLFIGQVTLALSQINRAEHSCSVKSLLQDVVYPRAEDEPMKCSDKRWRKWR